MQMAEEKDTTEVDEEQADAETSSEETTEENSSSTEEIDYEALAAAEAERATKAEKAAADLAFKKRKAKREGDVEEEAEDPDKVTKDDLKGLEQRLLKQAQESTALAIARANTSSEAEAQAALTFWKNRVVPTENLQEDILFAIGGMNRKKDVARAKEIERREESDTTVQRDVTSPQRQGMKGTEPKLPVNSPLKEYKYLGNNVYSKKLQNGKTMFVNTNPAPGEPKSWTE